MNTTPRTNGLAVASFVFGLLSWCVLPVLGAVLAIVLGHIARSDIRRAVPGSVDGDLLAVVGLVLGWAQVVMAVLATFLIVVFFGSVAAFFSQHWGY